MTTHAEFIKCNFAVPSVIIVNKLVEAIVNTIVGHMAKVYKLAWFLQIIKYIFLAIDPLKTELVAVVTGLPAIQYDDIWPLCKQYVLSGP